MYLNTRTDIVIDDKLTGQATKATGAKAKREAADRSLRLAVRETRRLNILDLAGQNLIDPDYDVRVARGKHLRTSAH